MNKTMISQELYDNLCLSLGRNAKALKGDVGFSTIKKRLERNARISFEGVEVEAIYLEMAQEALARIVVVNGKKYDTTLDKIVLLDLAEALALPPSETPALEALGPEGVSEAPAIAPIQRAVPVEASASANSEAQYAESSRPVSRTKSRKRVDLSRLYEDN